MIRPPPTAAETRALLGAHGLSPSRQRGQNFVVDGNTLRAVVRRSGVQPGDLVAEVGPGLGALTLALRGAGAEVVAVEVDAGLVRVLTDEVLAGVEAIRVVHADAVHVDWPALLERPAVFVGNLPYNVATPIVLRALRSGAFTRLHAMVQREVGERWAAGVGHERYGAVSVKIAAHAEAAVDGRVSRRAFHPVPNVDSVTVRLVPRPWPYAVDRDLVLALVEAGFSQRRKQLRNPLAAAGYEPRRVEAALTTVGLPTGARAEELDLAAWAALTWTLAGDR